MITTVDNGKFIYKKKIYNLITCWTDALHVPVICKYQMIKEDGSIYKELHPYQAEIMQARGEITKYQKLTNQ